jgi:hypothetical protein
VRIENRVVVGGTDYETGAPDKLNGTDPSSNTSDVDSVAALEANNSSSTLALDSSLEGQLQKARLANNAQNQIALFGSPIQPQLNSAKVAKADIHKPDSKTLAALNKELSEAVKKARSGEEQDRAAVDQVFQKIVKAYGLPQDGVTGLEFDPKSPNQGGTIGSHPRTFIVIGPDGVNSAEEAAATILHESNHVGRNVALAKSGIDRGKFNDATEGLYSATIETEAYQTEVTHAKQLGVSDSYVQGAKNGVATHLKDLELAGGASWRKLAEDGKFDELQAKFRERLKQ